MVPWTLATRRKARSRDGKMNEDGKMNKDGKKKETEGKKEEEARDAGGIKEKGEPVRVVGEREERKD